MVADLFRARVEQELEDGYGEICKMRSTQAQGAKDKQIVEIRFS